MDGRTDEERRRQQVVCLQFFAHQAAVGVIPRGGDVGNDGNRSGITFHGARFQAIIHLSALAEQAGISIHGAVNSVSDLSGGLVMVDTLRTW
jgi:hypothetical protein